MGNYSIINLIRDYKEGIEERITKLSSHIESNCYYTTEIMTETWIIKGDIAWLVKWLENDYYDNHDITRNQYRLVKAYLYKYENDVWSRLFDLAADRDKNTYLK